MMAGVPAFRLTVALALTATGVVPVRASPVDDALIAIHQQNYSDADAVLIRAAEQGDAKTQGALGVMYFDGIGVPIDHRKALFWSFKAAEQGRPEAQYRLALMYRGGSGFGWTPQKAAEGDPPNDPAAAEMWFRRAADTAKALMDQGDTMADITMAMILDQSSFYFSNTPKRDVEVIHRLLHQSAQAGNPVAEYAYGYSYEIGFELKDVDKAVDWYTKAALHGHSEAMVQLGRRAFVRGDKQKAASWFRVAARYGNTSAIFGLKDIPKNQGGDPSPPLSMQGQQQLVATIIGLVALYVIVEGINDSRQSPAEREARTQRQDRQREIAQAQHDAYCAMAKGGPIELTGGC